MRRCEHVLENGRRCVRKGQRFCYQHLSLHFKECNNESDLALNDFKDLFLEGQPIYRDKSNNCFSKADFLGNLKERKKNPYTGEDLWTDRKEFDKVVSILDQKDRDVLQEHYYPSELSEETARAISRDPQLFEDIGMVGAILKADFTNDFKASISAINYLQRRITESPDSWVFFSLSIPEKKTNTVMKVLEECSGSCIHGVGSDLINIYLYTRNHLSFKLPLAPAFLQTSVNSVILFPYIAHQIQLSVYLFKNDPTSSDIVYGNYAHYSSITNSWTASNWYQHIISKIQPTTLSVVNGSLNSEIMGTMAYTILPSYIFKRNLVPLL